MKKILLIMLLSAACMMFYGCSAVPAEAQKPAFEKVGMVSSMGGNADLSESDFSYTVYLSVNEKMTCQIEEIRLTVGDKISKLVTGQDELKYVSDAENITVEGKISFKSEGLTKAQIEDLAPYAKSLEITTDDGNVYTIPL